MKKLSFLLVSLFLTTAGWGQSVFLKYGPANGVQCNSGSTYLDTACTSSNVVGLFSGGAGCTGTNALAANGTCVATGGASGANPAGTIGLTAVNGSAGTFLRSDGAPALSQAIAPTWSALHIFSGNATGGQIQFGASGAYSAPAVNLGLFNYNTAAGTLVLSARNSGGSTTLQLRTSNAGTDTLGLTIGSDGGTVAGAATGGDQGVGTINMQGCFVNGVACSTGGATGANPTGTIGLTAVNGSAGTFLRSDGAPALSPAISPTWSGTHTFSNAITVNGAGSSLKGGVTVVAPPSGDALTVNAVSASHAATLNGSANSYAVRAVGSSTSAQSFGVQIAAGTTSADAAFLISNQAGSANFLSVNGIGGVSMGPANNSLLVSGTTGAVTINAPNGSGAALSVTGVANSAALSLSGSSTSGQSKGMFINAGTTSADWGLRVQNQAGTANYFGVNGDGSVFAGVNGSSTFNISAPGNTSIGAPTSGVAFQATGAANANTIVVSAPNTASQSFGLGVVAGTNASDYAIKINNAADSSTYMQVAGDGGVIVGSPTGGDKGLGAINAQSLFVQGVSIPGINTIYSSSGGVSASGMVIGQTAVAYKTTLQSRNTTATPSNDSDLVITNVPAGTYKLRGFIGVSPANTVMGIIFNLNSTATVGVSLYSATGDTVISTVIGGTSSVAATQTGNTISFSGASLSSGADITLEGTVIFSTSGTYAFSWAQAASNASNLSISSGSYVELVRVN